MAQRVIDLKVLNEFIQGDNVVIGGQNSAQATLLEVDFRGSDVWAGTSRYVSFTNARGESTDPALLSLADLAQGETEVYFVPVPAIACKYPGEMTMTLTGYVVQDGEMVMRVTTEAATFRVLSNDYVSWSGEEVTPTTAEKLQADIDMLKDMVYGNWMFLEVGADGILYEYRVDGFPVEFALSEGVLEVSFA